MASISVAGDTSGSITIAAPAVSGTTTLTLPTTTGTLVVTSGAQTIEFADGSASAPSITNSGDTNTGIFFPAADTIAFAEGGTETMRLDSSGNVGIGTTSPTQKLNVAGTIHATGNGTFPTTGEGIEITPAVAGGDNYVQAYSRTASSWQKLFINSLQTAFGTNGTERMRIDSNGNVLVGATSPGSWSGSSAMAAIGYVARTGRTGSFSNNVFNINWTGSAQLWIDTTNVGTFAFTSDYRIKKNIETSTTPALERIAQIRPVTYEFADYKELFKADGVAREGFIAHELAEVIPSAVEGEKDAEDQIQSLKLDALCSVMVKAIQEQQTIIETLKADIAELKAKVNV